MLESDFFCLRPKASEVWFTTFDECLHVKESAEFHPHFPVHLSIDCGVETGAVWFQILPWNNGVLVKVFADYYSYDVGAESAARAIRAQSEELCGIGMRGIRVSMDSAANHRTAIGVTVRGEYERAGLQGKSGLEVWPQGNKLDGLSLIEALLMSADGTVSLVIHPRCVKLIQAFQTYKRKRVHGQLTDRPEDPQHPAEDMIDPLAGGLKLESPDGRSPLPQFKQIHAGGI